ncbi:MAG: cation:proton antiporter [Spirochaetales bacterium]|nr:cation:proton antiporter [Spirochaetales bacterium]
MSTLSFIEKLGITDPTAITVISVSFMLFFGFLMTRITKVFKLPNVTAYIVSGIIMGPFVLNLIPQKTIEGMSFIGDIALSFIAFGTGEYFKVNILKKNGRKVLVITIMEALASSIVVFIGAYYFLKLEFSFSLILSALASATAPASTLMTIKQTGAKGDFVDTLLGVVALDDVVGLIAFSIAISISSSITLGILDIRALSIPLVSNLVVLIVGGSLGFLLKLLLRKRSTDNRLIVTVSILFGFCGICAIVGVSPLLGCMSMGMVYINATGDERLFKQLSYFSPPILLLFFVRSGLNFDIRSLFSGMKGFGNMPLSIIGIVYFFTRMIGKYSGAYLGSLVTNKSGSVRNYLGLALIPQAGVAIGLAAMGAKILGGEEGRALETIILSSSVLYELIGPASAKLSLYLSHSYPRKGNNKESVKENTIPAVINS